MRRRSCFEMSSAKRRSLRALSLGSLVFHSVRGEFSASLGFLLCHDFQEVCIMPSTLVTDILDAFAELDGGIHHGFRPVHAKGFMYSGTFTPSPGAAKLTRAPHSVRPTTPVTVRFSLAAGIPTVADNDTEASPQSIAVRFHLAEHVHTDIIAHSVDGFPA